MRSQSVTVFKKRAAPGAAFVVCLAIMNGLQAAPLSLGSSVSLRALAEVGNDSKVDARSASQPPLALGVSARSQPPGLGQAITARGNLAAIFVSASAGEVRFDNIGWTIVSLRQGGAADLTQPDFADWSYTFVADTDTTFELGWRLSSAGNDTFGLNGFAFRGIGTPEEILLGNSPTGALTRQLSAGQQYTVTLGNLANIAFGTSATPRSLVASMDGFFNWRIGANQVPEPGSAMLLASALACAAIARRRRQR
jgi:hypothetical protein